MKILSINPITKKVVESYNINRKNLYHLPWSSNNNIHAWIELTNKCNLACIGCYRENRGEHKSFSQVKKEIDISIEKRNCEKIIIAGGEPLLYPHLERVIKYISGKNVKPVLLTNGVELTLEKIIKLKQVGLYAIIIHLDSGQNRPGWEDKNELELNKLRRYYADMVYKAGIEYLSLIMTVHDDTLQYIPDIVLWAQRYVKKIKRIFFICYRYPIYKTYSEDRKNKKDEKLIYTLDIFNKIREVYPDLHPHSYLNGTIDKNSLKWLFSTIFFTEKKVIGCMGNRFVKYLTLKYFKNKGRYTTSFIEGKNKKLDLFVGVLIDNSFRKTLLNYFKSVVLNYLKTSRLLFMQSFIIIQPPGILSNGKVDMCNGCPDAILYKDEFVPSCRLEECLKYGQLLEKIPINSKQPEN